MGSTVARKSGLALGLFGSGERRSFVSFMVTRKMKGKERDRSLCTYPSSVVFLLFQEILKKP